MNSESKKLSLYLSLSSLSLPSLSLSLFLSSLFLSLYSSLPSLTSFERKCWSATVNWRCTTFKTQAELPLTILRGKKGVKAEKERGRERERERERGERVRERREGGREGGRLTLVTLIVFLLWTLEAAGKFQRMVFLPRGQSHAKFRDSRAESSLTRTEPLITITEGKMLLSPIIRTQASKIKYLKPENSSQQRLWVCPSKTCGVA